MEKLLKLQSVALTNKIYVNEVSYELFEDSNFLPANFVVELLKLVIPIHQPFQMRLNERSFSRQNLPAKSKAVDVQYRTLWGWIDEYEENRQIYNKVREEQDEMIRVKIDEFRTSMRQGDI